jgi:penicillin-binding protein 2
MTPMHVNDMAGTLRSLSKVIDLPESVQDNVLKTAKKEPSFRELIVRRNLTQRELARLAIRSAYFPGVSFEKSLRRIYPQGALTCHITGYVSPISRDEIERDSSLQQMPDLSTGKIGVEYAQEPSLRGMPGYERIEVNARGRPIRVVRYRSPGW